MAGNKNWNDAAKRAGENLDTILYNRRISCKEFAAEMGITPRALQDLRYKGIGRVETLCHAAELLGVSVQVLLDGDVEGDPFFVFGSVSSYIGSKPSLRRKCCFRCLPKALTCVIQRDIIPSRPQENDTVLKELKAQLPQLWKIAWERD